MKGQLVLLRRLLRTVVAAENFELNDLKNVDTTTVTPSAGDCLVYDSGTTKFEAAAGIDGGYYG